MFATANQMVKLAVRAVLIVLMTLGAVNSAWAEVRHLDSGVDQSVSTASEYSSEAVSHSDDEGDSSGLEGALHCAFSHCVHVVPAGGPEKAAGLPSPVLLYVRLAAKPLADALPDGPENPPRA